MLCVDYGADDLEKYRCLNNSVLVIWGERGGEELEMHICSPNTHENQKNLKIYVAGYGISFFYLAQS